MARRGSRGSAAAFRVGLPLLVGVVIASFGLGHFMQAKFDVKDSRNSRISWHEYEKLKEQRKEFSLEDELQPPPQRMEQKVDLDAWKNPRIPRGGE